MRHVYGAVLLQSHRRIVEYAGVVISAHALNSYILAAFRYEIP